MLNKEVCRLCWKQNGVSWLNPMPLNDIDKAFDNGIMICPWMRDHKDSIHIHTYAPPPKSCPFSAEHAVSNGI